jgi:viroplasmin and RNaseH domain-containing protein
MGKKVYVVFEGRNPEIYLSWSLCFAEINGWNYNVQKGYNTLEEAEAAYKEYYRKVGRHYSPARNRLLVSVHIATTQVNMKKLKLVSSNI